MHSSTSSSSERVPTGGWTLVWIVTFGLYGAAVIGWETLVRTRGLGITAVDDTQELWIKQREQATLLGDQAIILVGASRMQLGIDLQVMDSHMEGTPVQLALSADPFLPVLEHLANDDTITGTVVVSFTTGDLLFITRGTRSERWTDAYDDFKVGKTSVFYQPFEDRLREMLNESLVSFQSSASPQQLILGISTNNYVRTLPDRSQQADYSKVDRDEAYQTRLERIRGVEEPVFKEIDDFSERIAALESLVDKIVGRGGEVIFIRMPSVRGIREIEETRYPRAVYWDKFAAQTNARSIHFDDYEQLSGFDFPDGLHMDVSDQPAFTRALSLLLTED